MRAVRSIALLIVSPLLILETAAAEDPLIEKAQSAAESFTNALPDYICQQVTERFWSNPRVIGWRRQDVVSAEVLYDKKHESYRNVVRNGFPVGLESLRATGSWSTGEFATQLIDLFSYQTDAEFRFRRYTSISGVRTAIYDYEVQQDKSHWAVEAAPQRMYVSYEGAVWIDSDNGRVLRMQRRARQMPADFPIGKVESVTDYAYVSIGGAQRFLLPVRAETVICERGLASACNRNTIAFRNYKKFSGEAKIIFEP